MRIIFISLLFLANLAVAQDTGQCKQVEDIARMEANAHLRVSDAELSSLSSDNFDVKYYRCEWEVDPAIRYIRGKITLYYTLTSVSGSITLDLMAPLATDSVKQRNVLLNHLQANNTLQVNFAGPVNAGTLDSISIYYKGVPPNTGFGSFIQDMHAGIPVMWSLSEPYGARDWWPCKNGLDDKADSIDIIITHPITYKAASNGLLQSETPVSGGTKMMTHWKHRYPIATYLICMAVTNYVVFNNSVQLGTVSLPMQTHCYPESLGIFQANTQNVLQAMVLFHQHFGDYPFIKEKYGHVQFGWGGGMEHQTSTFIVAPNEGLMAHELGHQWFGDKITTGSWEDIWLNEGFATFLAAFHMETKYPATLINNRRAVINNITSLPGGSVKVNDTTSVSRIFSSRLSYNKGSYLVYMLRFILGDETFFRALKAYQQDPSLAYGFARTADLKKILERESGRDLTKFFDQWYQKEGFPSYHVEWSQLGAANVKIKMNQVTSHPSVSFFEMPVALKFKNASQEKTVIVDNRVNGESFLRNIGFIADTVIVDPDYWIISRNNTSAKIPVTSTGTGGVDIFPNPVTDPFSLYLHDFNEADATVRIFTSTGQLVFKKDLALVGGTGLMDIPAKGWAKGMYIIKVEAGAHKIIKQLIR